MLMIKDSVPSVRITVFLKERRQESNWKDILTILTTGGWKMISTYRAQIIRKIYDMRIDLINKLNKLGYKPNGKPLEEMSLLELEQIHINEKHRNKTD